MKEGCHNWYIAYTNAICLFLPFIVTGRLQEVVGLHTENGVAGDVKARTPCDLAPRQDAVAQPRSAEGNVGCPRGRGDLQTFRKFGAGLHNRHDSQKADRCIAPLP